MLEVRRISQRRKKAGNWTGLQKIVKLHGKSHKAILKWRTVITSKYVSILN